MIATFRTGECWIEKTGGRRALIPESGNGSKLRNTMNIGMMRLCWCRECVKELLKIREAQRK